jgi:hypothetical protein
MKMGKPQIASVALAAIVVAAIVFLPGGSTVADPPQAQPVLVCIDSTVSTDDVRAKYQVDAESIVRQAARNQNHLYAAACGANATGNVDWPVEERFRTTYSSEILSKQELNHQVREVINGPEEDAQEQGIVDLLAVVSKETTPIAEMLAVTARQCEQAGGECQIYMFTDGEWADGLMRIKDGVSRHERRRYLQVYVPRLRGFAGSTVNFVGVGLGTEVGEVRLDEARSVASELVEQAGGRMGHWTTRL